MNNASQYGDLATQLLTESRRSTATNTLLKYNDVLVRAIIREQRDLEARIEAALARSAENPADAPEPGKADRGQPGKPSRESGWTRREN